jgi:hypothetical protein
MKTRANILPNLDHRTRKIRKKNMTSANKDPKIFYLQRRNKTRL